MEKYHHTLIEIPIIIFVLKSHLATSCSVQEDHVEAVTKPRPLVELLLQPQFNLL